MSNPLSLSDDEFLNTPLPEEESEIVEEETIEEEEQEEVEEEITDEPEDDSDEDEPAQAGSSPEEESDEGSSDVNTEEETTEKVKQDVEESTVDFKTEYEKLLRPFKANGKEVKVDSVDEAIQLMQMGANYTKKMAALKPGLKVLRVLEDNGLMDEGKLGFLIDLSKKNPDAINKLIKDSGIDPLDIDVNNSTEYKPSSYTVDDKELELDAVLEEISSTSAYSRTIDVVSNKWDVTSKKVLLSNPTIIRVINEHIEHGIYDQITSVIEKERMLGRLTGLSDLEAYKEIGDALYAQGKFGVANQAPVAKKVVKPAPKVSEDPTLKARKKAAGLTQSKPTTSKVTEDFNPLALSDAEFEKYLANQKFV